MAYPNYSFSVDYKWETVGGWKCLECGKIYRTKEAVISHYWYAHTDEGLAHRKVLTEKAKEGRKEKDQNCYKMCSSCGEKIYKARFKAHEKFCSFITKEYVSLCEDLYCNQDKTFEEIKKISGFPSSQASWLRYVHSRFDQEKAAAAALRRKKKNNSKTHRGLYASGVLCRAVPFCSANDPRMFRTKGERETAEILTSLSIIYQYEALALPYKTKKGELTSYIPDFYLPSFHLILELKGDKSYRKPKTVITARVAKEAGYHFKLILNGMVSEEHIRRVLRGYGYKG
jgi:hypothetical protein